MKKTEKEWTRKTGRKNTDYRSILMACFEEFQCQCWRRAHGEQIHSSGGCSLELTISSNDHQEEDNPIGSLSGTHLCLLHLQVHHSHKQASLQKQVNKKQVCRLNFLMRRVGQFVSEARLRHVRMGYHTCWYQPSTGCHGDDLELQAFETYQAHRESQKVFGFFCWSFTLFENCPVTVAVQTELMSQSWMIYCQEVTHFLNVESWNERSLKQEL